MKRTTAIILMLLIASFLFAHQRIANANPGADLIVENITLYPSAPVDGDSVAVYVTVKNQGDANVTTDFWVPIWIDEEYKNAIKVTEDLAPGELTDPTVIYTWTASPGDHDFKAKADGGYVDGWGNWQQVNIVPEDDELNNERTLSIFIGYPDLIVENLFIEPSHPNDGETVNIRAPIKNIGQNETKRDFWVTFYIDDNYAGAAQVTQNLGPNESTPYPTCPSLSWTVTPGQHEYKAKADGGYVDGWGNWQQVNIVKESNETNNELTKNLQVGYSDLVIINIYWAPQYPKDGETITFYATVKNEGLNETTRDFYVTFLLDDTNTYFGAALVTDDLAQGENKTVSATWLCTPGTHTVKVKADGGYVDGWGNWQQVNVVAENNETNNLLAQIFHVSQCDYILSDIQWNPTNPTVGESVTIYGKVKNVGPGISIRDFYVTFFINNSYIGASQITVDLEQGQEYTVSRTWIATSGTHTVKVKADGGYVDGWGNWQQVNVVAELSEDNNVRIENMSDCDASIVLSHSDGYAGMQIIINGTGFKPNSHVTILWDALNSSITTFSDDDGKILTQFTIPNTYLGIHDISATDGEDTAPCVNFELRRARVSTPVLYDPGDIDTDGAFIVDCNDATSELGEVTKYEFQRSLSPVFTSPTTNSRSESKLQLSNLGNGTYYFRVRAWDEDHGLYSFWSNTESITVLVFSQVVLTVRVSDNGVPIPSANVTVRFEDGTLVASKLTNQSGYTTFTLTPGTYNIASQTAGYSINQTITSDTLIIFDPLAKVPEFQTAISMLIVAIISAAFMVLVTKKRRKNF
jgi:subtilase family serine protease